jgi:predicted nucleic acid-binding protein
MSAAGRWFICRVGYVESVRAVSLAAGEAATRHLREEWPAFGIIEIDQRLVEEAAVLAVEHELRSLDALHLAAALVLPGDALSFATWDRRLHAAAGSAGLSLAPASLV